MAGRQIFVRTEIKIRRHKKTDKWYKRIWNKLFDKRIEYYDDKDSN